MRMNRATIGLTVGFFVCAAATAMAQATSGARIFRGSVGGSNFQMRLNIEGTKVSGTYSYDTVGEDIKLTGQLDAHRQT